MKANISKELGDAINTIKNFCEKQTACEQCPFLGYVFCLLEDQPFNWPEVIETKTYFIEVDNNE